MEILKLANGLTVTVPETTSEPTEVTAAPYANDFEVTFIDESADPVTRATIKYGDLSNLLETGTELEYSSVTAMGVAVNRALVGRFMPIQKILAAAYSTTTNTAPVFEDFIKKTGARIDFDAPRDWNIATPPPPGDHYLTLLGTQVLDGIRKTYPEDPEPVTSVWCGFIKITSSGLTRFAIGQQNRWDVNGPILFTLIDGGLEIKLSFAESWPAFNASVSVGTVQNVQETVAPAFTPNEAVAVDVTAGSLLRFGIDTSGEDDLLNNSQLYYTVDFDGNIPDVPSPLLPANDDKENIIDVIYNIPPPKFSQSGNDYARSIVLTADYDEYLFAVMAYGPGRKDSPVCYFKFTV